MTALSGLAPLANLIACGDADPERLAATERALRETCTAVWRPAAGWVVGALDLPGRAGNGPAVTRLGLAFAEGEDLFAGEDELARLATTAREHPKQLAGFGGDFTLLAFDGDELTAVRSCAGVVPLYHWSGEGRAIVATQLTPLVRLLGDGVRIDRFASAVWAGAFTLFPQGRTFFEGVRIVPAGHFLRLRPGAAARVQPYWDAREADPGAVTPEEHAARLRGHLVQALERDLPDDATSLLTISGGVDSTSLAALAGRTLGRELATFTLLPPDQEMRPRNLHYIDVALEGVRVAGRLEYIWEPDVWERLRARLPPLAIPLLHPALQALPEVLDEQPVPVLFGGEYADDLMGHWWRIFDWVDATPPSALIASRRRLPLGRRDVGRWVKWRALSRAGRPRVPLQDELGPIWAEDVRDEYRDWVADERRAVRDDDRPNRHLAAQMRINLDSGVAQNWEALSAFGVRRSFPFLTRAVLELTALADVRQQLGPGTKRLMRQALAADVPAENLNRQDKGGGGWGATWEGPFSAQERLSTRVAGVLAPSWQPEAERLNHGQLVAVRVLFDLDRSLTGL